jgi:hypothetical protein
MEENPLEIDQAIPFTSHVTRHKELVAGQNPPSSQQFANVFVRKLVNAKIHDLNDGESALRFSFNQIKELIYSDPQVQNPASEMAERLEISQETDLLDESTVAALRKRVASSPEMQKVGTVELDKPVVSEGCGKMLHFPPSLSGERPCSYSR